MQPADSCEPGAARPTGRGESQVLLVTALLDTMTQVKDRTQKTYGSTINHQQIPDTEVLDSRRKKCRRMILGRHLMAALTQRMWTFAVVLLLTVLGPKDSFRLIASYGITVSVVVALFSPSLGALVDRHDRLSSVIAVTVGQNLCTAVCGACFLVLVYTGTAPDSRLFQIMVVLIHVFGACNNLFYGCTTVCLERDWVVVISGEDEAWLRDMTAVLRQIDLCCDIVAPSLVSFLSMASYDVVALAISGANCLMIMVQFSALGQIYKWFPSLSHKHHASRGAINGHATGEEDSSALLPSSLAPAPRKKGSCPALVSGFFSHAATYVRQRSAVVGLALAMLYLTVLSFSMVMVSYLMMRGMRVIYVGISQGAASGMGVLGAVAYQWFAARIGTMSSGVCAIWSQVLCLTVAMCALLYPLYWPHSYDTITLAVFIIATVLSRFGLYMFDVAAIQVFQELVEEKDRNVVGGFQNTIQSVFALLSYILTLWFSRPSEFVVLAAASYFMVFGAAVVFSSFAARQAALARSGKGGYAHHVQAAAHGNGEDPPNINPNAELW